MAPYQVREAGSAHKFVQFRQPTANNPQPNMQELWSREVFARQTSFSLWRPMICRRWHRERLPTKRRQVLRGLVPGSGKPRPRPTNLSTVNLQGPRSHYPQKHRERLLANCDFRQVHELADTASDSATKARVDYGRLAVAHLQDPILAHGARLRAQS